MNSPVRQKNVDSLLAETNGKSLKDLWDARDDSNNFLEDAIEYIAKEMGIDRVISLLVDGSMDQKFLDFQSILFPEHKSLQAWMLSFGSDRSELSTKSHLYLEAPDSWEFAKFLEDIRETTIKYFEEKISTAVLVGRMPPKGIILYFTEDISLSIIITYNVTSGLSRVEFIAAIPKPQALFDIDDIVKLVTPKAKNIAKSFLQSGHKAVIHQGIVTHVDRRRHFEVFGPTIDTLIIASILSEMESSFLPESLLEIGCGSGHIFSVAINKIISIKYADAIDINPFSIICANENSQRLLSTSTSSNTDIDLTFTIGKFDPNRIGRKYDLIVCNPPYITLPDNVSEQFGENYYEAVSGTQLIKEILASLPKLLSAHGRCLLMVSSTTIGFEEMVPEGLHLSLATTKIGLSVPFDIEAVFQDERWLNYLLEKNAISKVTKEGTEKYFHSLLPYWIGLKS